MSDTYTSVFAPYIEGLIAAKRAVGYSYGSAEYYLRKFDNYCAGCSSSSVLSRDLVLGWATAKDGEDSGTHRVRLAVVRELGKHMQALGIRDAFRSSFCSAQQHRALCSPFLYKRGDYRIFQSLR